MNGDPINQTPCHMPVPMHAADSMSHILNLHPARMSKRMFCSCRREAVHYCLLLLLHAFLGY